MQVKWSCIQDGDKRCLVSGFIIEFASGSYIFRKLKWRFINGKDMSEEY